MKLSGETAWRSLKPETKWKKENVLDSLYGPEDTSFGKEGRILSLECVTEISHDRDILLARLARENLSQYYEHSEGLTAYGHFQRQTEDFKVSLAAMMGKATQRATNRHPTELAYRGIYGVQQLRG